MAWFSNTEEEVGVKEEDDDDNSRHLPNNFIPIT
jgi:hypothetical protein